MDVPSEGFNLKCLKHIYMSLADNSIQDNTSQFFTVAQASKWLNSFLKLPQMQILIRGEITEYKPYSSGHLYFSLVDKDGQEAKISCVMWKGRIIGRHIDIKSFNNGTCVDVWGRFSLYEKQGTLKFEVINITPVGRGAVLEELEKLRLRLQSEGLFAEERKRPLPAFPKVVGVVTSAQGQAIQDICKTLKDRAPRVKILLSPCLCQGEEAPASIIRALKLIQNHNEVDCIILGRGGGSQGDLQAYNSEELVRAISQCPKPVISAVGHEGDLSLSDLVADLRASTPTRAAEMVTITDMERLQNLNQLKDDIQEAVQRYLFQEYERLDHFSLLLSRQCIHLLNLQRERLYNLQIRLEAVNPRLILHQKRENLKQLKQRLIYAYKNWYSQQKQTWQKLSEHIDSLSPQKTISRGYSIVTTDDDKLVNEIHLIHSKNISRIYNNLGCISVKIVDFYPHTDILQAKPSVKRKERAEQRVQEDLFQIGDL